MEDELRQLTEAAANGDATAMSTLLSRYLPELRAYVRLNSGRLIRSRESNSDSATTRIGTRSFHAGSAPE